MWHHPEAYLPLAGEGVRAIIWDLDETFWRGTITEGGILAFVEENERLIVELARRGIVSSICSKNDFEVAKEILVSRGLWEYFVFPSIDWSTKGPRVSLIIDDLGLRPETVLFLDDNPHNLAEAASAAPGLLTAPETAIAELGNHPRLRGKRDLALRRLSQYRLLEQRKREAREAGGDPRDFLRDSGIVVTIEYDIEPHLDRAVELINRTNQMNHTKVRLPESLEDAKRILRSEISKHWVWAGLVRVRDRYGDYGYVGFFMGLGVERPHLTHFCFSCRAIGMDIDTWVFRHLRRPSFEAVGETSTNVWSDHLIDWINVNDEEGPSAPSAAPTEVRLRGGCDLDAIIHYFGPSARTVVETNYSANHTFWRRDTATSLEVSLDGPSATLLRHLADLGAEPGFTETGLFDPCAPGSLVVFSPWGDARTELFRHRAGGELIGFSQDLSDPAGAVRALQSDPDIDLSRFLEHVPAKETARREAAVKLARGLARHFDLAGEIDPERYKRALVRVLDATPSGCRVALLAPPSRAMSEGGGDNSRAWPELRDAIESVASNRPYVRFFDIDEHVSSDHETTADGHFDRIVYYRLFRKLHAALERAEADGWLVREAGEA